MKKVYILQRVLTTYRTPFFNQLRDTLERRGIELNLIYGCGNNADQKRGYLADLPWGLRIRESYMKIGKEYIVFQPYLRHLKNADLIIAVQEMKLLLNYLLLMKRKFSQFKLAYWGHSVNFQEDKNGFRNKIKRKLNNAADWWFAYTSGEARLIEAGGFPPDKITVVQNSIDTDNLLRLKSGIGKAEINKAKFDLGIRPGQPVCLYCGGMYKEKRLDFLWEVCQRIKKKLPDFHMIFVGGGTHESEARAMSKENPWIHFVGPTFERAQILYFMLSDLLLMPGLVGLVILDCFTLEVPLVTTQYAFHSPEVEYLENGRNGIMTKDNVDDYCEAVLRILSDPKAIESLKEGCRISAGRYSMGRMIESFTEGIIKCLDSAER